MKRNFMLFLCIVSIYGAIAQNYKDWSKWSITLEGGANRLDGDIRQVYNDVIPNAINKISFGGSVEYTLTPIWSMGLEYYYLPYRATDVHYNVKGLMHTADYFMAFNLQKWFFKKSKSKWGLWATLGGGLAYYNADYVTDGGSTQNNQNYPDVNKTIKDGLALTVPVGALVEYNFTKNFALGTKLQYRSYNKDNVDGRDYRGVTNDFSSLATLQLRWKFNAQKKNHTRNISLADFDNDGDSTKQKMAAVQNKVDSIQKNIAALQPLVDKHETVINEKMPLLDELPKLTKRVQRLEDIICPDGPDTDNDGVPDCRDRETATPENTPVDFWGRSIPISGYDAGSAAVYFDFDRTELDEEAHRAIRYAANKMKSDPALIVEVRGFTDNMGNNPYNANLSQRRADVVKNQLVTQYGIDESRIIANGKGKYKPDDKYVPFRPYRTCMFFYSK